MQLKRAANFPGSSKTVLRWLKDAGLKSHSAARKQKLSDEHRLYRLAFAEENLYHDWSQVVFSDECVFSSVNDGPARLFRPRGTRHNLEYVAETSRSGHVTIACWGWISARGIGMLHRIEERGPNTRALNALQYVHVLENVMVPSVRVLYPEGVIQFQQDNSPIHTCQMVQEWFARQDQVDLVDWPPYAADLNPIENVWWETKRTMSENWPDPPPASKEALWDLVTDAWDEVASSEHYASSLVRSMPRRLRQVIDNDGYWSSY